MGLHAFLRGRQGEGVLQRDAQRGFTLVEMAIVLVIIGLIVGGILKGQEIVNNGRVKTQVAQIDSIKAAVATFQDTYGFYPGDYKASLLTGGTGAQTTFDGNEDGIINSATTGEGGVTDAAAALAGKEMSYAWLQLTYANLMGGANPDTTSGTTTYSLGGKVPGSFLVLGDFNYQSFNSQLAATSGSFTISGKMVRIQGNADAQASSAKPIMRAIDASNIDSKYDDGSPNSGGILASLSSTDNCCSGATCNTATAKYSQGVGQYCNLYWLVTQ